MKKSVLILVLAIAVASVFTSCASSKGGCFMSKGYIGYGNH
jgi:hypothetical protein